MVAISPPASVRSTPRRSCASAIFLVLLAIAPAAWSHRRPARTNALRSKIIDQCSESADEETIGLTAFEEECPGVTTGAGAVRLPVAVVDGFARGGWTATIFRTCCSSTTGMTMQRRRIAASTSRRSVPFSIRSAPGRAGASDPLGSSASSDWLRSMLEPQGGGSSDNWLHALAPGTTRGFPAWSRRSFIYVCSRICCWG